MKKISLSLLSLLVFGSNVNMNAQRGSCSGEHNYCYPESKKSKGASTKDDWQYNNQSKSAIFAQNETSEVNMIVYKDTEYMLSFCSDNDEVDGKIQFKIYDYVTKAVTDEKKAKYAVPDPTDTSGVRTIQRDTIYKSIRYEKTKKLLFDNTKKENTQTFNFISDKTRKLLIEVFVPGGEAIVSSSKDDEIKAATYACVGMLVLHQKALVVGFQK